MSQSRTDRLEIIAASGGALGKADLLGFVDFSTEQAEIDELILEFVASIARAVSPAQSSTSRDARQ
jgi:hypothetical protein